MTTDRRVTVKYLTLDDFPYEATCQDCAVTRRGRSVEFLEGYFEDHVLLNGHTVSIHRLTTDK